MGALGSSIGGLLPFLLGRAGGELFLLKRIDRNRYEQLRNRFEKQEFLALLIPSCLPPPTPWKPLVFAAGVFKMRLALFMLAVFLGRCVRFGVPALLTVLYGPQFVAEGGRLVHEHTHLLLGLLALALVAVAVYALRSAFALRKPRARAGEFEN